MNVTVMVDQSNVSPSRRLVSHEEAGHLKIQQLRLFDVHAKYISGLDQLI